VPTRPCSMQAGCRQDAGRYSMCFIHVAVPNPRLPHGEHGSVGHLTETGNGKKEHVTRCIGARAADTRTALRLCLRFSASDRERGEHQISNAKWRPPSTEALARYRSSQQGQGSPPPPPPGARRKEGGILCTMYAPLLAIGY
jgi:hypothetical protein